MTLERATSTAALYFDGRCARPHLISLPSTPEDRFLEGRRGLQLAYLGALEVAEKWSMLAILQREEQG